MIKYIDAERLKAEIERLKEETPIGISEYDKGEENGRMVVLTSLQSAITSLQQEHPEVELEKEIDNFLNETGAPYVWCNDDEQKEWCNIIARHFYELGLNTRKEENK